MVTRPSEKEVLRPSTGSGKSRNSHKSDKTFTRADKLLLIVLLLTSVNKGIVAIFTVFTNRAQPFRCLDDFIPHEEILLVHPEIKQDLVNGDIIPREHFLGSVGIFKKFWKQ